MAKSLVVYYTWASHTSKMAGIIAARTGADLLELVPEKPYSSDYGTVLDQAKKEKAAGILPRLSTLAFDVSDYEVLFVGSPVWWGTIAPPLASFLRDAVLSSKIIMPFTTHGGGGKGHSDRDIAKLCPKSDVREMYAAYEGGGRSAETEIAAWIGKNKILQLTSTPY